MAVGSPGEDAAVVGSLGDEDEQGIRAEEGR